MKQHVQIENLVLACIFLSAQSVKRPIESISNGNSFNDRRTGKPADHWRSSYLECLENLAPLSCLPSSASLLLPPFSCLTSPVSPLSPLLPPLSCLTLCKQAANLAAEISVFMKKLYVQHSTCCKWEVKADSDTGNGAAVLKMLNCVRVVMRHGL